MGKLLPRTSRDVSKDSNHSYVSRLEESNLSKKRTKKKLENSLSAMKKRVKQCLKYKELVPPRLKERRFTTGSNSPSGMRGLLSRTKKRIGSQGRVSDRGNLSYRYPRKHVSKIGRVKARKGIFSKASSPRNSRITSARTSRLMSEIKAQKADRLENIFENSRNEDSRD